MDKQTLSHYGWIVVMTLTLSLFLAFATPFGKYIGRGASNIIKSMVEAGDNAVDEDKIGQMQDKWEDIIQDADQDAKDEIENGTNPPSDDTPTDPKPDPEPEPNTEPELNEFGFYYDVAYVGKVYTKLGMTTMEENVAIIFSKQGIIVSFEENADELYGTFGAEPYSFDSNKFYRDDYGNTYQISDDGKSLEYYCEFTDQKGTLTIDPTISGAGVEYEQEYNDVTTGAKLVFRSNNTVTVTATNGATSTHSVIWENTYACYIDGYGDIVIELYNKTVMAY